MRYIGTFVSFHKNVSVCRREKPFQLLLLFFYYFFFHAEVLRFYGDFEFLVYVCKKCTSHPYELCRVGQEGKIVIIKEVTARCDNLQKCPPWPR